MSEDILLGVVARTDKTKYDTSADALVKLKSAGVSDRRDGSYSCRGSGARFAAAPAVPPTQSVPAPPPVRRRPATSATGIGVDGQRRSNLPTTAEATAETNLRFAVFVSAPQRDGFFDTTKDIQDSIKDIRDRLSKEKNVILTITDDRKSEPMSFSRSSGAGLATRRTVEGSSSWTITGGTLTLQQAPMIATTFWVSTMMQVGTYKKEFTGAQTQDQQGSPLTYNSCVGQIVPTRLSAISPVGRKRTPF